MGQRGSVAEISARPASPFIAAFAGAVVLRGEATGTDGSLTLVRLAGGGEVRGVDQARGPVAVSVFSREVLLESPARTTEDSNAQSIASRGRSPP